MTEKILVVDDEEPIRNMIAEVLTDCEFSVDVADSAEQALEKYAQTAYDLVISDIRMGGMSGIELLREIKKVNPGAFFIIITSHASMDSAISVLKAGAYDYLIKPFEDMELIVSAAKRAINNLRLVKEKDQLLETVKLRNSELEQANVRLSDLAVRDGLTGLYNHRFLQEALRKETSRAERHGRALSVVFMDVDHFKLYNDSYGHQAGDLLLKSLSQLILRNVRKGDIVARYGGEEFVILMPEVDLESAKEAAEKIRLIVAEHAFKGRESQPDKVVSISVGIASFGAGHKDFSSLLQAADAALYNAKKSGRNRVMVTA